MSDQQKIIELLRQKSDNGIHQLQLHYGPLMRYIISPILSDEREREECLSDISMKVWEKIDSYDPEKGSFRVWLSALARNTALNRARKNKREDEHQELDPQMSDTRDTPEENMLRQEKLDALRKALGQLGADEKNIFYRKYYYMQSTRQIASELGLTERSVEGKLYRIKRKLRLWMGGEDHA